MAEERELYHIGIDIGGTNVRFGITDVRGNIVRKNSIKFKDALPENKGKQKESLQEIEVTVIKNGLNDFIEKNPEFDVASIGVGIAGQIDEKNGVVLFSPNLYWHDVDLRRSLEGVSGKPVNIFNDLRAITYGEWQFGAGKGESSLICIFVGTGIGSGLVIGGTLVSGCSGTAGEIGHMPVKSGGRKCTCGNRGCLEAYAGGWGIAAGVREAASRNPRRFSNIINIAGGLQNITAESVSRSRLGKFPDKEAEKIVKKTAVYLADGIIGAVSLVNPCAVILGGGVMDGMPDLFEKTKREVYKRGLKASTQGLKFLKPGLGDDGGIIGSARLSAVSIRNGVAGHR